MAKILVDSQGKAITNSSGKAYQIPGIVDMDYVVELPLVPTTKVKSIILVDGKYYLWGEGA